MSKKPSFHEQHKQKTKDNKKRQTDNKSNHKPKQPKQKTKQNKQKTTTTGMTGFQFIGELSKRRQLCVISFGHGHNKKNTKQRKQNTNTHKAIPAGDRSNTAPYGNQESPHPGSPKAQGALRKV